MTTTLPTPTKDGYYPLLLSRLGVKDLNGIAYRSLNLKQIHSLIERSRQGIQGEASQPLIADGESIQAFIDRCGEVQFDRVSHEVRDIEVINCGEVQEIRAMVRPAGPMASTFMDYLRCQKAPPFLIRAMPGSFKSGERAPIEGIISWDLYHA